jgi:DNA-binding MarR family transcriptional regulator
MPTRKASKAELAGRVWTLMFDYLIRSAPERTEALGKRGLTPNDSRALFTLDAGDGQPMRALAKAWNCDPSNATWIVDRLERLGLAERRAAPGDRRIKLVALTPRGRQTLEALLREFHRPPAGIASLGREDLESLQRVLVKLTAD